MSKRYEKTPWGQEIPYTSPTGVKTTLYNIGVVAEAIGRTSQTVRKWEVSGVIPQTPFKQNGKRLYSQEHIDAIVKSAEEAKILQGSPVSQTNFSKLVYKRFQEVNDLLFKTKEEDN